MSDIDNAVSDADADLWAVQMPSGEVYTVTVDQLDDAFQRGLIDENTLVMKSGMDDWASLADVLGNDSDETADAVPEARADEARAEDDDAGWPSAEDAVAEAATQADPVEYTSTEYASDRIGAELGLAAPNASDISDATDELFNRLIAPSGASSEEEPTQREMALSRPGGTTLLNYPPPPPPSEAFSAVAPVVQAAAAMGVATPAPAPLRAPAPEPVAHAAPVLAAPLSRPVPPPADVEPFSRPVPPPSQAAPFSRPVPPPSQAAPYSRPVPPPSQAAPYSRPVPPPADAAPYSRPVPPPSQAATFSRPVPPPMASTLQTVRSFAPPARAPVAQSYPPQAIGGVYPPPVISSAPSEAPGFAGPKSTPPVAYEVGDIDIPTPKFRSRGRGAMLAVAASIALVGGAIGLSRMDGSSFMLFPQSSAPAAAVAPSKPYTPPPAKPEPKPEPIPEPVAAKPEPATPKAADASEAKLADDMKKALAGAKVKPTKAKAQSKASMRPSAHKASRAKSSSSDRLGKGGDKHDPLNGSL